MGTFLMWFQGDTFNVVQHPRSLIGDLPGRPSNTRIRRGDRHRELYFNHTDETGGAQCFWSRLLGAFFP